jgi:multiple sugar transport system substrate-binding protein
MKRVFIALLTVALLVSVMAGCTGQPQTSSAPASPDTDVSTGTTSTEPEPAKASGEVTIWYYWETEGHQIALNNLIDKFNKSQSDITVTAKYIPFADFKKQLSIGVSAENLPDMVIIDNPDHASYAAMGIFEDLTGKFDVSQYFPGPVASCTYDDKLFGVPLGSNCLALFYNKDMLSAANVTVPTTWDELKAAAVTLTSGNVKGFAFSSLQNEEGTFGFMPFVWSTGATSFEIDTEKGIKALTFIKDLYDSDCISKECINWTQGDVRNQFVSGNVAMMINGPWQIPTMRSEAADLNWDVALLPKDSQYASDLGGENWGIIKGGNVDASIAFLDYATQKENITELLNALGYIASRSDIAATQFTNDAQMQLFAEEMQYAQPRGPHPKWPSISDAISLAFNEVITGASTPADAAAKAQQTIDSIMQ